MDSLNRMDGIDRKYSQARLQQQWQAQKILHHDGVVYREGRVTLCDCYCAKGDDDKLRYYWHPLYDTTVQSIESYLVDKEACWVSVDIYYSEVVYGDDKIVCGAAMVNQGFVACVTARGELNWSIRFDFSVVIHKVKLDKDTLICYGTSHNVCGHEDVNESVVARIDLKGLPSIVVDYDFINI